MKTFMLSLSTWMDHTYAVIEDQNSLRSWRIQYKLTKADAKKFNDWDGYPSYSKGDTSERFWSESDALKAAIKKFNRMRKRRRWMLYQRAYFYDVGPEPIAGPPATVKRLHRAWARTLKRGRILL